MKIYDIMSKRVVTVEMDDSLETIKKIFDNTQFHHLIVTTSGKLIGVISDRDVLRALSPKVGTPAETEKDAATLKKRAHQIMTREPISIRASSNIFDAIDLYYEHGISCIPVIDENRKPIGIISWKDIIKAIKLRRDSKIKQDVEDLIKKHKSSKT